MNPLLAVIICGVAMFVAHILFILLFRTKPEPRAHVAREDAAAGDTAVAADVPGEEAVGEGALVGRTTTAAARLAEVVVPRTADDVSPLMGRRGWMGLAWGAFTASTAGCLAASGRFMFPNVLNEPPQQFTIEPKKNPPTYEEEEGCEMCSG